MRLIKLVIEYDGTGFSGYEIQPEKRTIRQEVEWALSKLFKEKISINGISRTDSGVHAISQVISFTIKNPIPLQNIPKALNSFLPQDIRATKAYGLKLKTKIRKTISGKEYEYLVFNGQILPPELLRFVWHIKPKIDITKMKKAASLLVGRKNFMSFCAAGSSDRNPRKKIFRVAIKKRSIIIWEPKEVISIRVKGSGFLYKMVRNIVGTLVDIGIGKLENRNISKIIQSKDRKLAGRCAPPQGLCLIRVYK